MSEETEKKDGVVSEVPDYHNEPDPRLSIRAYLLNLLPSEVTEPDSVAEKFKVSPVMVREVIAAMLMERSAVSGAASAQPAPSVTPVEVTFEPTPHKEDPIGNESIDDTIKRLKKVDDAPLRKWARQHERNTQERLGLVDPRNPRNPSEYEWHQVDWNMEACYAGWDVLGLRIMGKRQMSMFIPLAALKRALDACPTSEVADNSESSYRTEVGGLSDIVQGIIERERGF